MASPELALAILSLGLVLTSRRAVRGHYRHDSLVRDDSHSAHPVEYCADLDARRRLLPTEDYRPVGNFTSAFYDIV